MKVRNVLQNPGPEPDSGAVFSFICQRCDREFKDCHILSECRGCRVAGLSRYGLPIRGGMGGE